MIRPTDERPGTTHRVNARVDSASICTRAYRTPQGRVPKMSPGPTPRTGAAPKSFRATVLEPILFFAGANDD
jgi:hypothetical protein